MKVAHPNAGFNEPRITRKIIIIIICRAKTAILVWKVDMAFFDDMQIQLFRQPNVSILPSIWTIMFHARVCHLAW